MAEAVIEIPARRGKAAHVARGGHVKVINTHGEQVVDTWAFNRADPSEFMSMAHTRAHTLHIVPRVGDVLRTNRRRPILTLVEDTSGGIHDTMIAACDRYRYAFLGVKGHHDNCADNLIAALADLSMASPHVPSPLNLFMNIPWTGADHHTRPLLRWPKGLRSCGWPTAGPRHILAGHAGKWIVSRSDIDGCGGRI